VPKLTSPVKIGGVTFGNALMNGAYIGSKTLEDVEILARSSAGGIVVGSISVKPRSKNAGPGYWHHKERFFTLNSFGLPNGGMAYFKKHLPAMVSIAHQCNKPIVANVVGFSHDEFVRLVVFAEEAGVDLVELNFGCPNVWDTGKQKKIISYHPDLVHDTLKAIERHHPKVGLSVKISPLPPDTLHEVCQVLNGFSMVRAVTATNSYPNASVTIGSRQSDDDKVLAGLAGRALKPISLGVVKQLRDQLTKQIDIIGVGGVGSANDVRDYLDAGAAGVQIASALVDDGPAVFDKILFQGRLTK
jgi:dihydroorotate dehydrogenase (fumarate)